MTTTPTNIIQSNDYYAFGLQHNTSWTRDNSSNNFLYDGGSEINTTTNWYDLPARNYDPALGRFFQIDPLAHADHTLTPFHYAGNNPIGFNDPTGLIKRYDANGGMGDWEDDAGNGPVRNHDGGGESGSTGVTRNIGGGGGGVSLILDWSKLNDGIFNFFFSDGMLTGFSSATNSLEASGYWTMGTGWVSAGEILWRMGMTNYLASVMPSSSSLSGMAASLDDEWNLKQDGGPKVWYTYDHLSDMDIVRQHTLVRTAKTEVTTIRVVVINYTDGIFGTDHEIISYGSRTKTYLLDDIEFDRKILAMPIYGDPVFGEMEIDEAFYRYIYGTVNEHLDCDCYTEMHGRNRLGAGAPHR